MGATKVKLAAPKSKYVEHILIATHAGEAGIAEVFRALNNRVKDQTWTIVFKSLIIVHLMIREGEREVTLRYLRKHPRLITVSHYSDAQEQGRNIRHYSQYLLERARTYGDVRTDYVRSGEGRLRKLSIEKGLLREVECVQTQIRALLKCTFLDDDVDNEISLLAFRLLVMDLLVLFHVVNEGVINVLEHYFEMSRYDAERALEIYKTFTKQTADVVEYLQQARGVETATRLQIPNLKHAPTSLTSSLEEYLHDPDFDVNRRQYLAQQEAKKSGKPVPAVKPKSPPPGQQSKTSVAQRFPSPTPANSAPEQAQPKPVAPDLIDFFESIESEQTHMFSNQPTDGQQIQMPQPQNQFAQQAQVDAAFGIQMQQQPLSQQPFVAPLQQFPTQTGPAFGTSYQAQNPYNQVAQQQSLPSLIQTNNLPTIQQPPQHIQTNFTGVGFGGYTPSDQNAITAPPMPTIPQQFTQPIQQPIQQPNYQQTQQQPQQQQSLSPAVSLSTGATDTNPFRQSMMTGSVSTAPSLYATSPPVPTQPKSTNPFARQASPTNLSPTSPPSAYPISTQSTSAYPQAMPISAQPTVRSMPTGTNPFARSVSSAGTGLTVPANATGASVTNPFRQSIMAQQQQNGAAQGTMGGWENLETVPVFPRNNGTNGSNTGQQQQGETGW
ncbi:ANTH-domain-containing protein [Choiromyces venosus 120613-1]|uniref:ANTH-domain-containing protein n=1 Tax=Choiromyces venosus 120613-1 TaxID=1336337 RepID=A0A3N4JGF5_9PEZI|nr:ANTH-domain-containing protein [Choiromyces venosus 120613-1]